MLCKFCELEKPLIEAHIIAKCLLKPLMSPVGPIRSFSKDVSTFPKRLPSGVYDTEILCAECDNSFSPWEDYTAELLYETAQEHYKNAQNGYYIVPAFDYAKLKLCLLSILWRMSISDRPEFKNVSLGSRYEGLIHAMLTKKDAGDADIFSIAMLHLTDYVGSKSALGTRSQMHNNTTMYNLGLPGFVAVIKIGEKHHPHVFQTFIMKPEEPLFFGLKEFRLEDDWKPAFQQIWSKQRKK